METVTETTASPERSYPSGDHAALLEALGIPRDSRILDIGGGHNPFAFADVVVDIDFTQNHHRDGGTIEKGDQRLVQADICSLPFSDNSFDFVICLHVLEHVEEPARACRELMRVARQGFIETPRKWTEYYAGHPTHRWLIDDPGGVLRFEPITYSASPFMNFALSSVWSSPEVIRSGTITHANIPSVQFVWEERFEYEITAPLPAPSPGDDLQAIRHYHFARHLLYWGASPETGRFHAGMAKSLLPENQRHRELHNFYLILSGEFGKAWQRGCGPRLFAKALLMRPMLWAVRKLTCWSRKIISTLGDASFS